QQRVALTARIAQVDPSLTVRPLAHFPTVRAFDADRLPQPMIPEQQERGRVWLLPAGGGSRGLHTGRFTAKQRHVLMVHEGGRGEVGEQTPRGNQGPHDIDAQGWVCLYRLGQAETRMRIDEGEDQALLLRINGDRMPPKILQKL